MSIAELFLVQLWTECDSVLTAKSKQIYLMGGEQWKQR